MTRVIQAASVLSNLPVRELLRAFRNPLPLVLDRLGVKRHPYVLETREGLKLHIRPGVGDRYGAFEVFGKRAYTSLGEELRPGAVIVDVGANIGCYSLLAANAVGRAGRVIALEPSSATYRQLENNVALNKLTNISCRRMAMASQVGTAQLHSGNDSLFASLYVEVDGHRQENATETVKTISLVALMAEEGLRSIDLLKLDCEGAEHEIIAGMDREIAARIAQISLELHPLPGNRGTNTVQHLIDLGYQVRQGMTWYFRRAG